MKVALVTGAAAGIGAGCARRLAQDGIAIGVLDLDADRCARTVAEVEAVGGKAMALGADISEPGQVAGELEKLRARFGPITILVNNAGISGYAPFVETRLEDWNRILRVNLTGAFLVTQLVVPDMIATGWGRIVNISSSAAQTGAAQIAAYASSKGGIISLTRVLAIEFGPQGITANAISPTFITGTIMSEASFANAKQPIPREVLAQTGPIRREGKPEDIAGTVAWLTSEEAGFITGQVIPVNGGRVI